MHILRYYEETIVDGPGIRFAIYFSGCQHTCRGCHNPESWNQKNGRKLNFEEIDVLVEKINNITMLDGVTLSGGDPFFDSEDFLTFLKYFRTRVNQPILVYTGYTYEELLEDTVSRTCLKYIDFLIDGKFEIEKRAGAQPYRGSSNQRFIKLLSGKKDFEIG